MLARATLFGFGLLAASLSCGACSKPVDLKQTVQVTDVSSGWFDFGIQNGKNKLVPSVTFKLRKNADVNLSSISLNLTFIFIDSQEHADDVYVQSVPHRTRMELQRPWATIAAAGVRYFGCTRAAAGRKRPSFAIA
jgi:hypothetical protein